MTVSAISLQTVKFLGTGLARPECVVAHASGLLFVPDWTEPGGITVVTPGGGCHRILATAPGPGVALPLRANGIALEAGGSFLIAHLGAERGAVYRLFPDGRCALVTDSADGRPLPPANFVLPDSQGRLWITISTTKVPRALDYRPDAASGFIALHDASGTRIVADGLGYTNECLLSADERTLWVNETFARRLTTFDVVDSGLANGRTLARFGPGSFPDGLTPCADDSLLVTSIVSNRVIRVAPSGATQLLLEDADAAHVAWVEQAFQAGTMERPHLDQQPARLRNISNLAFGGPNLTTAYLGCLLGDAIACFDSPVSGRALPHWHHDLGPLARFLEDADP